MDSLDATEMPDGLPRQEPVAAVRPSQVADRQLPEATLSRLTGYLRVLTSLQADGQHSASSGVLAEAAGVNPAIVRKDLSLLGSYGTRGVGYVVSELSQHISKALGLTQEWRVAIIGAGNLGRALAGYGGFRNRGFDVVALIDADPQLVGQRIGELVISDGTDLAAVIARDQANMVVLAVPAAAAQPLCDELVKCGISSILSFAPVPLQVPAGVHLRKVDLATELQILAYHAQDVD
ncbi:redox-sensing transcriptional repressor Rex [Paeniglutamicibacter cryotolerans]|uniref:redox-sensing transcriptional repressor Rex n=1 Tax=Paeniglutamicibacter cryotolerans TaxID=670079 RepID=UPI0038995407